MSGLSDAAAPAQGDVADGSAQYWLAEIAKAKKPYAKWHSRGDKVITRYKDEALDREMIQNTRGRKMNMLWSNVETTKPALYSKTPEPNISRRNKDADPVGRWASIVLERCVEASLAQQDFDKVMRDVVQDLLLPGQGIAIEEYGADVKGEGKDQAVDNQRTTTRYLHWKDWLTNSARMWSEVWFFAYRSWLTRDQVAKKFGEKIAQQIQLDHKPEVKDGEPAPALGDYKATVWTVWSLRHGKVFQVAPGLPDTLLSEMAPPTRHEGFWPFPRPVQATVANDTIIPVPDYAMYQDQADAIDQLTNKIYVLSKALRLRGLYASDLDAVKRLLQEADDADLIPVDGWQSLMERGGLEKQIAWVPLKDVAAALVAAMEALEKQKAMLYEVTGMGDIIRGASDPGETATAQQIKSQWGSLRVRERRRDIERFARDIVRRKAEVIAEHFNLATLQQMSGVQLLSNVQKQAAMAAVQAMQQWQQASQQAQQQGMPPPPPPTVQQPDPQTMKLLQEPTWEDVMGLLRNDKLRGFVIDVETDSTVEPDQQAEQQKAVEFTGSVVQFLEVAAQILPAAPEAAPMLGELLLNAVRRFKVGETVETSIENFTKAIAAKGPPPPDPKMQAEQMRGQAEIAKAKTDQQTAVIKGHAEQTKAQTDLVQTLTEHHVNMAEKQADMVLAQQQQMTPQAQQAMQPPPGTGQS